MTIAGTRTVRAFGHEEYEIGRYDRGVHRTFDAAMRAGLLLRDGVYRRLHESAHYKGRWWDQLLYGILEDEWRARC